MVLWGRFDVHMVCRVLRCTRTTLKLAASFFHIQCTLYEDEVLENSHQRNPLKGHSSFVESEKLGELMCSNYPELVQFEPHRTNTLLSPTSISRCVGWFCCWFVGSMRRKPGKDRACSKIHVSIAQWN